MVTGRPTKYEPSMVVKAQEYLDSCSREATELPTIEGLALLLGVDDERIGEYAKKYPEFHATIKDLKFKQKQQLMNDGMYGGKEVNSAMAIFLLKANHGLIETSRQEVTGKDGESIKLNVIGGADFLAWQQKSTASSGESTLPNTTTVQDIGVASEGTKDINSDTPTGEVEPA